MAFCHCGDIVPDFLIGWDGRNAEQELEIFPQLTLIALDHQQIVSALRANLLRDGSLGQERIAGDHRPVQIATTEQLGRGTDLVLFTGNFDLGQRDRAAVLD